MRGLGFVGGEAVYDSVFGDVEEIGDSSGGGKEGGGVVASEEACHIDDAVAYGEASFNGSFVRFEGIYTGVGFAVMTEGFGDDLCVGIFEGGIGEIVTIED